MAPTYPMLNRYALFIMAIGHSMDIIEAIHSRASTRQFLKKPIPRHVVHEILAAARWAPSGVNTQPWHVTVVTENTLNTLSDHILAARHKAQAPNPDYDYYPTTWVEPYKSRRKACGAALYSALNIQYGDKEKRLTTWNRNYRFFSAPTGLLFFIDKQLAKGSWIDMGMFIQNVMLAARHFELASCPQASMAEYPDIVRACVNVDDSYALVCGLSLGYPDLSDPINQYRTERLDVDEFTTWLD